MKRKYLDLVERVAWTAAQAFAGAWLVTTSFDQQSLKIAGVAAAISVAKCIIGFRIGNGDSASTAPSV